MNKTVFAIMICLLLATKSGFAQEAQPKKPVSPPAPKKVEDRVKDLEDKVSFNEDVLYYLIDQTSGSYGTDRTVMLDVSAHDFKRIDTELGYFYAAVKDVEPLPMPGGGIKLSIKIGNPYSCSFGGISLDIRYGAGHDDKNFKKKKALVDILKPASWTVVTVEIPKVDLKDVKNVSLKMDIKKVSLPTDTD